MYDRGELIYMYIDTILIFTYQATHDTDAISCKSIFHYEVRFEMEVNLVDVGISILNN
jgi:hypothetical protein